MSAAPLFDLDARRAARRGDARGCLANIADGIAQLDAQVHSLAFCIITEDRVAGIERNLQLLRGLCSELRAHVTPT
jgi:hypothetical protein